MRTGLGINLRRAASARISSVGQINNTTWCLRNPPASVELLLVWNLGFNFAAISGDILYFSQQRLATPFVATATTFPVVPGEAAPPGQVGYFNSTTQFAPFWINQTGNNLPFWPGLSPFTVLPPGWSLCIQDSTTATNVIDAEAWWEAMTPEEFEHQYGDTGLAVKRPAGAI